MARSKESIKKQVITRMARSGKSFEQIKSHLKKKYGSAGNNQKLRDLYRQAKGIEKKKDYEKSIPKKFLKEPKVTGYRKFPQMQTKAYSVIFAIRFKGMPKYKPNGKKNYIYRTLVMDKLKSEIELKNKMLQRLEYELSLQGEQYLPELSYGNKIMEFFISDVFQRVDKNGRPY